MSETGPITDLLREARAGSDEARRRLYTTVYGELRKLARMHRFHWKGNETLNTTALIHESFIKLAGSQAANWENRTHFFATASRAIRQILVSYSRYRHADKRGGDAPHIPIDDLEVPTNLPTQEILDLDELLVQLQRDNERRGQIVECRLFGGMSVEEIATSLDISPATVKREWALASAWLYQELNSNKS